MAQHHRGCASGTIWVILFSKFIFEGNISCVNPSEWAKLGALMAYSIVSYEQSVCTSDID